MVGHLALAVFVILRPVDQLKAKIVLCSMLQTNQPSKSRYHVESRGPPCGRTWLYSFKRMPASPSIISMVSWSVLAYQARTSILIVSKVERVYSVQVDAFRHIPHSLSPFYGIRTRRSGQCYSVMGLQLGRSLKRRDRCLWRYQFHLSKLLYGSWMRILLPLSRWQAHSIPCL
jgi:hypothetical protein